ncbi:MAG: reverse transcriptase domain-containing protein [Anaerolineaceae bacterium]|jgi:RNA-directed DNA polymerase
MGLLKSVISPDNMQLAWDSVQENKGAPGVDHISVSRWARSWEANLARLSEQIEKKTYLPNKPKRIQVNKSNGKIREISILTVTDRVAQRAFLNIIEPFFENIFLGCSHAYRKNRSTSTAIQQLIANREQGYKFVLDADIKACFDNIDHEILLERFSRKISDPDIISLLTLWLKAGRKFRKQAVGLPQGGVISPLLCNIYLHSLDAKMLCSRRKYIRYADDFIAMAQTYEEALLINDEVEEWLHVFKLKFNPEKTSITSFDEGFVFLGAYFLRDQFAYTYRNKNISIKGKKLRNLYRFPPAYY